MRKLPWIFLLTLFIILIFIMGVNYGRQVIKTDAIISYLLTVTPAKPSTTPIEFPPSGYKTYNNTICGLQFLHPANLTQKNLITGTALSTPDGTDVIEIYCPNQVTPEPEKKMATAAITIKKQKIVANIDPSSTDFLRFPLKHPEGKRPIRIVIHKNLLPLFESTLLYTSQYPQVSGM